MSKALQLRAWQNQAERSTMAMLDGAGTTSPSIASNGSAPGRTLDSPPPMPAKQTRPPNVLFTPPADENDGLGAMGNDPMVQTMAASAAVDKAFQKLATLYPMAVDPLAQLQQSFRQLVVGLTTMSSQGGMGMGGPSMMPPLPMQSGATSATEPGPTI